MPKPHLALPLVLVLSGCPTEPERPTGPAPIEGCGDLTVGTLASDHPGASTFDRCVTAFGVPTYAGPDVADEHLLHVAFVLAEYLDNDEDGVADDPAIVDSLLSVGAANVVTATQQGYERFAESGGFADTIWWQPTAVEEMGTEAEPWFDATLEEVLHLVNGAGHSLVYPDAFAERDSTLTDAMDIARGGHFEAVPPSYPAGSWYHYDDTTCEYECMAIEYLYWALTTQLGAQSETRRCDWIGDEWELCTPEALAATDTAVHALLTDPQYRMPTVLPDGVYGAAR